ncbi:MAG TPA: sodium/glutamate symporter [Pyrinomonadaceae bacterium]|jgi:ESS family glutamate:Na+ symporter
MAESFTKRAESEGNGAVEITFVEGLRTLKLDLVLTLALSALFLYFGYLIQRRVSFLRKSSIPAAAIGGLLFALIVLLLRARGTLGFTLDTTLRAPLQTIFFTTIGLGATLSLLRAGGWRLGFFWLIASVTAIVQNVVGMGLASALGAPAPLGVICGSLTLTGGPATGLARAVDFEQLGISGAGALIIASATFGIFTASLIGNPTATALIRRFRLAVPKGEGGTIEAKPDENLGGRRAEEYWAVGPTGELSSASDDAGIIEKTDEGQAELTPLVVLRNLILILVVMGLGALLSLLLNQLSGRLPGAVGALFKLPDYIGAMIVAAIARNVDDRYRLLKINARAIELIGMIALAFFLVIVLMNLKLWELAGLAVPMLVILIVQVFVMIIYAVLVTFVLMGRDYEAAVTTSGHIGFGLGTTPNAVANMEALTEAYAPTPRSFLIVPVVGAFFIDFSNALIINSFVNLMR